MKSYQKILRRLISHPSCALEIIRKITNRQSSCCLKCGVIRKPQVHHTDKRGVITYFCIECKKTYSELYGTVFFRSKIPISKWCIAIIEWSISTGSISAAELGRRLDIKHESAWRMLMSIRKRIAQNLDSSQLKDLVEADEAWFGRKQNQDIVVGFVERQKRKLRLQQIPNVKEITLYPLVEQYIEKGSYFFTDSRISYAAASIFYKHKTTNHSAGEFARGGFVHSNTIEQIWGDIKGIIRTIHHGISKKYRHLYLAQYIFKYENLHPSNLFYNTLCQLLHPMFAGI